MISVVVVLTPPLQIVRHFPYDLFYSAPPGSSRQLADAILEATNALVADIHPAVLSNAEPQKRAVPRLIDPAFTLVHSEFQFLGQKVADGLQDSASRSFALDVDAHIVGIPRTLVPPPGFCSSCRLTGEGL